MMDNHLYNLFLQLVQEHKSLWRIKNEYLKDAAGCDECTNFWQKLEKDKEEHVKELKEIIKDHLKEN